jgi:hypothetical protein
MLGRAAVAPCPDSGGWYNQTVQLALVDAKGSGMKKRRRWVVIIASVVAIGAATVFVAPCVSVAWQIKQIADRGHRGQKRLFYETDYAQLLEACRELSRRAGEGDLDLGTYHVHLGEREPEVSTFPRIILDLEPAFVHIESDETVTIELLPGPDWAGVVAYPEGQEGSGTVKLIDGLWYWNSDYRDAYPEYMKAIDAMIEEGRRIKAARNAPPGDKPGEGGDH